MSHERFDPYYVWFGIPPEQQPPTHYRLLGLQPLEANGDVIANAAEQRMAHLRTLQMGPHAAESQRLLAETASAMRLLLDPQRKADYDAKLQPSAPVRPAPRAGQESRLSGPLPMSPPPRKNSAVAAKPELHAAAPAGRSWLPALLIGGAALAGIVALFVLGGAGLMWYVWAGAKDVAQVDTSQRIPSYTQPTPTDIPPAVTEPIATIEPVAEEPPPAVEENPTPTEEPPPAEVESPPEVVKEPDPAVAPVEPPVEPTAEEPPPAAEPSPEPEVPAEPQRLKPPTAAEQKLLLSRLAEVYPPEKVKSEKQAHDVALELLALAADTETPAAERFVMFRRAAELAVAASDAELLSQCVEPMAEFFDIDGAEVESAMLLRMASALDVSSSTAFARNAATFADVAAADGRYDVAVRVLAATEALPSNVLGETSRASVRKQLETLRERQTQFIAINTAERAVAVNPNDAAAQSLLGQWYCFQQQDWSRGLAHLALGADVDLRKIASLELAGAATPATRLAIANGWWDAAQKASPTDKKYFEERAYYWYQLIEPSAVGGLDRALLIRRLETLAPTQTAVVDSSSSAEDAERFDSFFAKAMDAVREKRYGDADRLFAHCVRIRPTDAAAANNYALTAVRIGQTQRAVKQWERMLSAGISPAVSLHNLERMRLVIDADEVPIDKASRTTLDKLIESSRNNARFVRFQPSSGWKYQQLAGDVLEDRACMYCAGQGTVDCPTRGCSRGKVRVMQSTIVGRNTVTGEAIVQSHSVGVPCRTCGGKGTVDCKNCSNGADRRLH